MGEFNQQKYVNEYTKEKYDRISINVKKGKRKEIEKHYKNKGYQSMNSYVNHLIDQDIEKSNGRSNQGGGDCDMENAKSTAQKTAPKHDPEEQ